MNEIKKDRNTKLFLHLKKWLGKKQFGLQDD